MTYTKHVVEEGKDVIIEDQCDSDNIIAIVDDLLPKAESLISLSVLFRVWKENSISLREYRMKGLVDYAEGIKCILNYFNSIYAIKEFLEGNYSEKQNGRKEKEGSIYYNLDRRFLDTSSWIRFGCEYRNRLIHQTNVPRDFGASIGNYPGEWFICLEDFINIQKKKMKNKEDRDSFVNWLESLFDTSICQGEKHYLRLLEVMDGLDSELIEEIKNIMLSAFDRDMKSTIESLIQEVHKEGTSCKYTYYQAGDIVFDPCTEIEGYLVNSTINTGINSPLTERIIALLLEKGYFYLFTQKKSIPQFVEQMNLLNMKG